MHMQDYKRALYDFSTAIRAESRKDALASNLTDFYMYAGQCNFKLGLFNEALQHFNMGVQISNESWELMYHRAILHNSLQQYPESTKDFLRAIELGPKGEANKFKVLLSLGVNLRKQGQLEKSKLYLKKASDIQPKNAFVYNNLG